MNPSRAAAPPPATSLAPHLAFDALDPPVSGRPSGSSSELPRQATAPGRRRIWELAPWNVATVAGVLLRRDEVESLLSTIGYGGVDAREDALRAHLLDACTRPCVLAEAVEDALHRRTEACAAMVEGCPMITIAEWWSRNRDELSGEDAARLLWRLASDPRPYLEKLASRVGGDLCARAMRLVRDHQPGAASGGHHAHSTGLPAC